jgi:dihydroxyacetone kinase
MDALTLNDVEFLVERMAEVVVAKEVHFCELDSAAGDGDFGMSLAKGFRVLQRDWPEIPRDDMAAFLKGCAMRILENCGGASGPIWGGAFSAAARSAKGKAALNLGDVAGIAAAAAAAIQKRGGAKRGDKTLLDALIPACESLDTDTTAGIPLLDAVERAAKAAMAGAEETRNMVASRGRASYVGERSLDHPDAGAMALGIIFTDLAAALRNARHP